MSSDKLMRMWDEAYDILKRAGVTTSQPEDVVTVLTDILRYVEWHIAGGLQTAITQTPRHMAPQAPVILTPRKGFSYDGSEPTSVICECGGEKAKTPHSHWCPMHKED